MTLPTPALAAEDGFTLPELLMGMIVGLIVLFGAIQLLDRSTILAGTTRQRVDSAQRGRAAMDFITRDLRSQVCLSANDPPLLAGSDTALTYYVNTGDANAIAEKHVLSLTGGDLVLQRYVGTGTPPTMTWPGTPTSTRTILENVAQTSGTPIFRYYAWGTGTPTLPDAQLATPLAATVLNLPVRIAISFTALPARDFRTTAKGSTALDDAIYVRSADPTEPTRGPRCN